jgi:hypothetical protein
MNEELHPVINPHPPFPFPQIGYQDQFEMDPIRIDPVIDTMIRFDPITIHITGIRLLRTEAPVDKDLLDPGCPKCIYSSAKPFSTTTDGAGCIRTGFLFPRVSPDDPLAVARPLPGQGPESHDLYHLRNKWHCQY